MAGRSMEFRLGGFGTEWGQLALTFVVPEDEPAYVEVFAFEPNSPHRSGFMIEWDYRDWADFALLLGAIEVIIHKFEDNCVQFASSLMDRELNDGIKLGSLAYDVNVYIRMSAVQLGNGTFVPTIYSESGGFHVSFYIASADKRKGDITARLTPDEFAALMEASGKVEDLGGQLPVARWPMVD